MTSRSTDVFERAEALGVVVSGFGVGADDLERLLEAIHQREGELTLLRYAVTRRLSQLPPPEVEAMKTKNVEAGRLAFRQEGEMCNAYWAPRQTSMEGALLLGSIRMNLAVEPRGALKEGFMALMKRTCWNPAQVAPERERSGRG